MVNLMRVLARGGNQLVRSLFNSGAVVNVRIARLCKCIFECRKSKTIRFHGIHIKGCALWIYIIKCAPCRHVA